MRLYPEIVIEAKTDSERYMFSQLSQLTMEAKENLTPENYILYLKYQREHLLLHDKFKEIGDKFIYFTSNSEDNTAKLNIFEMSIDDNPEVLFDEDNDPYIEIK